MSSYCYHSNQFLYFTSSLISSTVSSKWVMIMCAIKIKVAKMFSNCYISSPISQAIFDLIFRTDRIQLLCRNSELMRKLRNLWSSHKKYCTTAVPLRSYTPLSGYPHSRSSYDLDRTFYTSTPYTNRFRRDSRASSVGELVRNLSDLSINMIEDDDDPAKVRVGDAFAWDIDVVIAVYGFVCTDSAVELLSVSKTANSCIFSGPYKISKITLNVMIAMKYEPNYKLD